MLVKVRFRVSYVTSEMVQVSELTAQGVRSDSCRQV